MKKISFPTIDPTIRRLLIFFSTVSIGSVFIIYDVSTEMLIIGTVAAGSLTLFIFGAAKLSDLRPSQIKKAVHKAVEDFKVRKEKSTGRKSAGKEKASLLKGQADGKLAPVISVLKSFTEAMRGGTERLKATLFHRDEKFEEIDTALASAGVAGGAAAASGAVAESSGAGGLDLDDEEFEDALEGLDLGDEGLDDLEDVADAEDLEISTDAETPPEASADPEPDDAAVSAILEAHSDELEEFEELGEIEDLDTDLSEDLEGLEDLDDLDLDSLEIDEGGIEGVQPEPEEEASSEEEAPAADLAPPQKTGAAAAASGEDEENDGEFDMLAFANGGGDSTGLMALLKEDVKKAKTEDYDSLLRDMKGQKFKADDLVEELEDTLKELGNKCVKNTKGNMNE